MRRERIEPSSIAFQAIVLPLNYPLHSLIRIGLNLYTTRYERETLPIKIPDWVGQESNLRDRSMSTISSKLPTHWTVWDWTHVFAVKEQRPDPLDEQSQQKNIIKNYLTKTGLPINCIGIEPMSLLCESKILTSRRTVDE